jgi:short-subunit dehydrogenase
VEETASQMIKEVGVPDVIVNCAGSGEWLSLGEASLEHYAMTMGSPYLATAYTCKTFYGKMLERGSGQFVMVNSPACFFSFPGATGYTAARWALYGLVKSLQADLFHTNIKVSMVVFGKVDSPYFKNNPISEERIPKIASLLIPTVTTAYSGRLIANTIKSEKALVVRPLMLDICVRVNRIFPRLFRWVFRVVG